MNRQLPSTTKTVPPDPWVRFFRYAFAVIFLLVLFSFAVMSHVQSTVSKGLQAQINEHVFSLSGGLLVDHEHATLLQREVKRCLSSQRYDDSWGWYNQTDKVAMSSVVLPCLSYRYYWSMSHDASRYDLLSRIYPELGITVMSESAMDAAFSAWLGQDLS